MLFQTDLGYYSLPNRIASFISANWTSLEIAPLVHTWAALFFILIPIVVVLFSTIEGIHTPLRKVAAVLLILVITPHSETWLSLALSQFHHALGVALIMVSTSHRSWMKAFRFFVVFTAGFNTPLPGFLVPFIWIAWLMIGSQDKLVEASLLTVSTAIQAWIVLAMPDTPAREINDSLEFLPYALWIKQFLLPLGGWEYAELKVEAVRQTYLSGKGMLFWIVPILYTLLLAWLMKSKNWTGALLFSASVYLLLLSHFFAVGLDPENGNLAQIDVIIGGRYFFVPNVLFFLTLLTCCQKLAGKWKRLSIWIAPTVIAWALVVGLTNYFPQQQRADRSFTQGASWQKEVELWRENPEHRIRVWPAGWDIDLPPKE